MLVPISSAFFLFFWYKQKINQTNWQIKYIKDWKKTKQDVNIKCIPDIRPETRYKYKMYSRYQTWNKNWFNLSRGFLWRVFTNWGPQELHNPNKLKCLSILHDPDSSQTYMLLNLSVPNINKIISFVNMMAGYSNLGEH